MPIHCQTKFTKQLPVYSPSDWNASLCVWSIDWGVKGLLGAMGLLWMIPVHKGDDETTSENNLESHDERAKVVYG